LPLSIPNELQKYLVLSPEEEKVDRFKCPVKGCKYTTRLGPGALRMHITLKADPKVPSRHDAEHENYLKTNVFDMEHVRILAQFPRIEV
jgi:hypothetical protein